MKSGFFIAIVLLVFWGCKKDDPKLTENYFEVNGQMFPIAKGYLALEIERPDSSMYRLLLASENMNLVNPETDFFNFTTGSSGQYIVLTYWKSNLSDIFNPTQNVNWGQVATGCSGQASANIYSIIGGDLKFSGLETDATTELWLSQSENSMPITGNYKGVYLYFKR